MKVTTYDELEPELLGIGQTTSKSASLHKEASLKVAGHTKKEEKRLAKENRKEKNSKKGKVERTKTSKRDEKIISKRLRGTDAKEEFLNAQLESFVLPDEPKKKTEKKYPSQSKIGMPNRKVVRDVNKELSKKYGLDK